MEFAASVEFLLCVNILEIFLGYNCKYQCIIDERKKKCLKNFVIFLRSSLKTHFIR